MQKKIIITKYRISNFIYYQHYQQSSLYIYFAFYRKSSASQKSVGDRGERMYGDMEVGVEDEDSGVECSLEDIEKMERMDAWSKTLVAVKVLTEFKKRRKKTLEAENAKKERRKNLWKRLRLKLRIFNLFANKISSDDPAVDRILKLKRKLGKLFS